MISSMKPLLIYISIYFIPSILKILSFGGIKMANIMDSFFKKNADKFYVVFRVLIGFMFFTHGAQKLFGWFGSSGAVELISLMGLAGLIEFVGGLFLLIGLFTRITAVITGSLMLAAYFMAHFPKGVMPYSNGGELALVYFASLLVLIAYGAGKYGVDKCIHKE